MQSKSCYIIVQLRKEVSYQPNQKIK